MKKCFYFLFSVYSCFSFTLDAQVITTIAGDSSAGYNGDNILAVSASLSSPNCVAFDGTGNLLIADAGNNRIRKIDASGIITTVAGTGTAGFTGDGGAATVAELNSPAWVAVDATGNMYIADAGNQRIRKVSASGIISTIAGNGTAGYNGDYIAATAAELYAPVCIRLDNAGNIYIADNLNFRVRKVDTFGVITTFAGTSGTVGYGGDGGPATAAGFVTVTGLAFDGIGNMYISDPDNQRVRKIDTHGIITTFAGGGVPGMRNVDTGMATATVLVYPASVATDYNDNVYISETHNSMSGGCGVNNWDNRICMVDHSGNINPIAGNGTCAYGGDGGPPGAAALNRPSGIVMDSAGNYYIPDVWNNRIRKVTVTTGIKTMVISNETITIFPNPATTSLTITSATPITQITITNLLGQTLYTNNYNTEKVQIDVSNLSTGVYFVKINGMEVRKFVKL